MKLQHICLILIVGIVGTVALMSCGPENTPKPQPDIFTPVDPNAVQRGAAKCGPPGNLTVLDLGGGGGSGPSKAVSPGDNCVAATTTPRPSPS